MERSVYLMAVVMLALAGPANAQVSAGPQSPAPTPFFKYSVLPLNVEVVTSTSGVGDSDSGPTTAQPENRPTTRIIGSFVAVQARDGYPMIKQPEPDGQTGVFGGGCLLYQRKTNPKTCTVAENCTSPNGSVAHPTRSGYCLPLDSTEKTCWYTENYCVRHTRVPMALDTPTKLSAPANPLGVTYPLSWRVMSCQNITPYGCGSAASVEGINKKTLPGSIGP